MAIGVMPQYYTGRKLLNAKITPLTVSTTGVVTKGSAFDLAASFSVDYVRFNESVDSEEISAANASMRNHVNIKDDFEVEVGEIKGGIGSGLVLNGWIGVDFFLVEVVVSMDGGTTKFTVQAVCVRGGLSDEYAEGKSTMALTGKACGYPIAYILAGGTLPY